MATTNNKCYINNSFEDYGDCGYVQNKDYVNDSSNRVSIVSLNDVEESSTISDSDVDYDVVPAKNPLDTVGPAPQIHPNGIILIGGSSDGVSSNGSGSSLPDTSPCRTTKIESIAVQNSQDITFGNKIFYRGPVTINQYVDGKNISGESDSLKKGKISINIVVN